VNATSTFEATGGGQLITTTFGQGQAGNIFVNATDQITISGSDPNYANRIAKFPNPIDPFVANGITETGANSGLFANTETNSTGNGGDIEIVTTNFNLTDNAQISASTSGSGKGGNLTVTAPEAVTIRGNGQLSVETTGAGAAGNLTLDTQQLNISDSASISASTSSPNPSGVGGNLTINATESFNLTNQASLLAQSTGAAKAGNVTINTEQLTAENGSITTSATATSLGQGGNIDVNASQINLSGNTSGLFAQTQGVAPAGSLTLQPYNNGQTLTINLEDNPQISASTSASGKGGSLTVTAPEAVTIGGNGQLSVETTGDGAAGNFTIDTQRLTIADGAAISASTSSANPSGVGGNITINATESFHLTNQASLLAQSTGAAKAGNVTINTEQLTADNGSITTSARATSLGEGGSIDVNASQINLKGTEIGLLAETEGVAPAGALTLQPFANGQNLTINLQDNAKISAATSGSGEGGSLSVTAPESITIRGQGQLSVETTGDGAAGNLTIDTQNLTITDGATISASTDSANPDGLGGSLTINASESFTLTNQARLLAQSTGVAPAGTITVDTGQLTANNGSIETSATQSAGGAITITASDIRLFGDSDIRTDVASGIGGGGNITLTADTILAFADSDILAFAQDGKGGDITFNTPVFFGFAYAPAPKGTDPDTLDHNDRVDINATGAVEGVITLPDDSAVRNSLTPLSTNQIDTDKLIAESCIARRHEPQRGSFFITGTGGIPFRPGDLYDTPYQTGTVRSIPSEGDGEESSSSTRRPWKIGDPIIEPTGIYRLANGEVIMGRLCGE
jgi:large exoprotein involved in heme utilization and adhesion